MLKMIIVDDEFLIRYSLSAVFKDPSTEVFAVADGKTAFECFHHCRLDLCFLDIHLPDMNGLEIMKKLRDISPSTRIIIMTGSVITDAMMGSIRGNAHCLISKPFDLDRVREAVDRVLTTGKTAKREEVIACDNGESCIRWITDDYRKHRRKPAAKRIFCHVTPPVEHGNQDLVPADVVDTSESGICVLTSSELKPGHFVKVTDAPMNGSGVVRWSSPLGDSGSYRAGIQFIAPENIPHLMRSAGTLPSDDPAQRYLA
jgi:two-component system response regulator (stage 0 sporulation protein F)